MLTVFVPREGSSVSSSVSSRSVSKPDTICTEHVSRRFRSRRSAAKASTNLNTISKSSQCCARVESVHSRLKIELVECRLRVCQCLFSIISLIPVHSSLMFISSERTRRSSEESGTLTKSLLLPMGFEVSTSTTTSSQIDFSSHLHWSPSSNDAP